LARLGAGPTAFPSEPAYLPCAAALVVQLGRESVVLLEGARPLYPAALPRGANHLVALVDQTLEALSRLGIEDPGAYLRPLLEAALEESLRRGAKALTGPVVRGDAGTITAHLEALDDLDATGEQGRTGDTATTYRALARAALSRAGL